MKIIGVPSAPSTKSETLANVIALLEIRVADVEGILSGAHTKLNDCGT